ncbi:MAG TPA: hypothetical protein DC047_04535 [Blastocatellia bacterium]|nr:hypothetical protein [Blastocatellia bacterium]
MEKSLRKNLIAVGLVFFLTCSGWAQQGSSIAELKQQIAEKEAVDRDPSISPEVRKINRDFLNQQRQELHDALAKSIEDLGRYASQVSLTADQRKFIDAAILSKTADVTELERVIQQDAPLGRDVVAEIPQNSAAQPVAVPASFSSKTVVEKVKSQPVANRTPLISTALFPAASCDVSEVPAVIKTEADRVAADIVAHNEPDRVGNIADRAILFSVIDALTRSDVLKLSALEAYTYIGETTRTDKQLGTTAAAGGSTSAIEKPGWADLVGFAVEHGAIQQQVGDTNLTLSTTPYAFVVPSQEDTAAANRQYGYLKRLGLSASFNISDKNATLANVRRKNLSQYSAKLRLTSERGPNSKEFDARWREVIRPAIQTYLNSLTGGIETLFGNRPETQEARHTFNVTAVTSINQVLTDAKLSTFTGPAKTEAIAKAKVDVSNTILCLLKSQVFDETRAGGTGPFTIDKATRDRLVGTVLPSLIAARKQVGAAKDMYDQMLHDFERRPEASFSFTNNRPQMGAEYGTFNFLYQRYLSNTPIKLTLNAGSSFYHRPDPTLNQTKFRDFITTVSFEGRRDSPFKTTELDLSPMTYALTARYQRLQENRGVPNKKADIAVVQFKLDVPISKGVSIPLALTYANATEFNKEKHIRGNFGFTFDADKFLMVTRLLGFGKK